MNDDFGASRLGRPVSRKSLFHEQAQIQAFSGDGVLYYKNLIPRLIDRPVGTAYDDYVQYIFAGKCPSGTLPDVCANGGLS